MNVLGAVGGVVAFGVAWWLGLYLLVRDPTRALPRGAGLGLLAYAAAIAVPGPEPVRAALLALPAVLWAGALLRPERALPLVTLLVEPAYAVVASLAPPPVFAVLVVAPLAVALGVAARRTRALLVITGMLFALGTTAALLGADHPLVVAVIGVDLVVLGVLVAVFDAFDHGEAVRADMVRSALSSAVVALLIGGQVALVIAASGASGPLTALLHGTVAAAITVQVLASPLQAVTDRLALGPAVRAERAELRAVADALPLRDERRDLADLTGLPEAEFAKLTRQALRHYGDLGKLVTSPLIALAPPELPPLERARALKELLRAAIARLRPDGEEFGTSDEWRHYNALHFYYVVGVRPYSVRTKVTALDPVSRKALAWFAEQVPERTLHNWQTAATRIVAADLRELAAVGSG